MNVKLISITPNAEETIGYCARVSNPKNQENPNVSGLLKFCIKNGHWSVFEMANMVIEINTSRGIAAQILRHRSFSFQEFSQRYAKVDGFEEVEPRRQDENNRQNSFDDLEKNDKEWFDIVVREQSRRSYSLYKEALKRGIAKESARFLLPLNTKTRIYMNGTIRSWIHYLQLRTDPSTQKEHQNIANAIKWGIFSCKLPIVSKALGWSEGVPC